jgi:hypothetical protein
MTKTRPEKTNAPTSLVRQLEDAVLALEAAGSSSDEIFSFVNMIQKGFITNGMFSPDYIKYCEQIIAQKQLEQKNIHTRTNIILPGQE